MSLVRATKQQSCAKMARNSRRERKESKQESQVVCTCARAHTQKRKKRGRENRDRKACESKFYRPFRDEHERFKLKENKNTCFSTYADARVK